MHNVASDDGDSCEVTVRLIVMMVMVVITEYCFCDADIR